MRAGRWRRGVLLGVALTVALVAAGCGGGDGGSTGAHSGGGTPQLKGLITPGTLTVGTELPAPPFWIGKDYESLTGGFELDLSKEIGRRLGLSRVRYVEMPFSGLVAGERCPCDIDFSQVTRTDTIKPATEARIFDRTVDAFQALDAGQVNAILLDTPIVLGAVESRQVRDAEVVGQLKTGEVYVGG